MNYMYRKLVQRLLRSSLHEILLSKEGTLIFRDAQIDNAIWIRVGVIEITKDYFELFESTAKHG